MNMIARNSFAMAACVCALAANATTEVVWTNGNVSASYQWGEPANWTDAGGTVLTVAPTNAADEFVVSLCAPKTAAGVRTQSTKYLTTGGLTGSDSSSKLAAGSVNPAIYGFSPDSISNTTQYLLRHTDYIGQGKYARARVFSVVDPGNFWGVWGSGDALAEFLLPATESFVPRMSALSLRARPTVDVPDAGTAAAVGNIRDGGTLVKNGDGVLKVGSGAGADSAFVVKAGGVEFAGGEDSSAGLASLIAEATLHLDASDESKFVFSNSTERTWIEKWSDSNGKSNYAKRPTYVAPASQSENKYNFSLPAFMSDVKSPTGLPLVSFGAHSPSEVAELGPTNCYLALNSVLSPVREVVYVAQTPKGVAGRTVLGHATEAFYTSDGISLYSENTVVTRGRVFLNGERKLNSELVSTSTTFHSSTTGLVVIACSPIGDTAIGLLGSDRYFMNKSGGSRLGELLTFNRALTDDERDALCRHLYEKWISTTRNDAAAVRLNTASCSISVPAGRTARVGSVTADGGLLKSGDGTLVVQSIAPAGTPISVNGGKVAFAPQTVSTNAPADGAYIWLDANRSDTLTDASVDGYDEKFVSAWADCRDGVSRSATGKYYVSPYYPHVIENAVRGLSVLDFGMGNNTSATKTQGYFTLPNWNGAVDTYAGFIVFRRNTLSYYWNIFGSSDMSMDRELSGKCLLSSSYVTPNPPAATWTINGRVVDPIVSQSELDQTNEFCVIAFRSPVALRVDAIAKARSAATMEFRCGACQVGEFITYHRPISEAEFRDTEAYLMAKWLGMEHPAAAGIGKVTVASGVAAEISASDKVSVESVSGGSGELVKTGAGAVTVGSASPVVFSNSLVVEKGALSMGVDIDATLDAKALIHLDASQTNTFRFSFVDGGDGTVVTNITYWYDVRGNGKYARSMYDQKLEPVVCRANPTFVSVETTNGVRRSLVDFGHYVIKNQSAYEAVTDSAAMRFNSDFDNVREAYVVYADRGTSYIPILAGSGKTASNTETGAWLPNDANFLREGVNIFNTSYAYRGFRDGDAVIRANGEKINPSNFKPGTTFRVYTFVPGFDTTREINGTTYDVGNVRVGAISYDRSGKAGGAYIAEVLLFGETLTEQERVYLEKKLMAKWLGTTAMPYRCRVGSVEMGGGTSLALEGCIIDASSVSISGASDVTCQEFAIAEGASVAVDAISPSEVSCMSVSGSLALPLAATVSLSGDGVSRLMPGDYPILSATEGVSGSVSGWTLEISDFSAWPHPLAGLFVQDGAVVVRVRNAGTVLVLQ